MKKSETYRTWGWGGVEKEAEKLIGQAGQGRRGLRGGGPGGEGRPAAHRKAGHQRPLKESDENIAPVVLVVRHAAVAHVDREGHQEELYSGTQ